MLSFSLEETRRIKSVTEKAPIQADAAIPMFEKSVEGIVIPKAEKPIRKIATPRPAPELMPNI